MERLRRGRRTTLRARIKGRPWRKRISRSGRTRMRSYPVSIRRLGSTSFHQARRRAGGLTLGARHRASDRPRPTIGMLAPTTEVPQSIRSERGELKRSWRRRRSAGRSASAFCSAKSLRPRRPKERIMRQQPGQRRYGTEHVGLYRREFPQPRRGLRPGDAAFFDGNVLFMASSPRVEFSTELGAAVVAKASALLAYTPYHLTTSYRGMVFYCSVCIDEIT